MGQHGDQSTAGDPVALAGDGFWVFAYGSLMWRPGFPFVEVHHAALAGYRRCFCIYSFHHRGTPDRPGLVLGLDRGGFCEGLAYRVAGPDAAATACYLKKREQISGVYRETVLPVSLRAGPSREVMALAYIAERAHPGYAGELPLAVQAQMLRAARGLSGTGLDYLFNTLAHLGELGIRERALERLAAVTGPVMAREPGAARSAADALTRTARSVRGGAPALRVGERKRFMYRNWLSGGCG